ncbi:uncharacterized protein LOC123686492 isoform X2 [Harmonia axyridis]|uniref:uncharacterized protein LOC123686492 isoform X2 n=1 Tax=Harmonia axyridis TaxID=115357 RepID=UPI001E2753A4|nr:uncharacterized protein LOC123686492 isoform X2 [Harmonia axyridis]
METYCAPNVKNQKFRHSPSSIGGYYNVPHPRNYRQYGNDYLQGNYHRRPLSPYQEAPRPRDRLCPVALAVASFIVLIVVLTVAGLALYMGALHSEFPSPLVTFSCSIKVLRGDRFVGALQEKAHRYSVQLETLYKRSILGPALIECSVDRFGEDTYTIFFKLTLDRKRLPRSTTPIEKLIGDAITADLISKKPVFKNIRFAPGSLRIQEVNLAVSHKAKVPPRNETRKKAGVVLKSPVVKNISLSVSTSPKKKTASETKKSSAQGSFKISKTEADITEKQDVTTGRAVRIKVTTEEAKPTPKRTTPPMKFNKIAATEEAKTTEKITKATVGVSSATTITTTSTTPSQSTFMKLPTPSETEVQLFPFNSDIFDKEPWRPLFVNRTKNIEPIQKHTIKSDINKNEDVVRPVYTSFTNPSLTIFQKKINPLGVTNLKGHPIPVNKIVDITEPTMVAVNNYHEMSPELPINPTQNNNLDKQSFGMDDKATYNTNSMFPKRDDKIKNISAIFHDLVSSIGNYDIKEASQPPPEHKTDTYHHMADYTEDINFGQGQVEVVEGDEETLMKATTKIPLVTLLPVKSNSGVGKPLRKRPFRRNQTESDEDTRSFGDVIPLGDIDIRSDATGKMAKSPIEDFKIVGMLKFAPEIDDSSSAEYVRKAKMETSTKLPNHDQFLSEFISHNFNLSGSIEHQPNKLTPEKLKLLSEISKIYNMNDSQIPPQSVISTKAVRPIYGVNNFGFKISSKYLNKVLVDEKQELLTNNHTMQNCTEEHIICGDGKCLMKSSRCNYLKECSDGLDEENCTCADYLRTLYFNKKICDGIIDCWDFSDENNCDWCHQGQHICSNAKVCVDKNKICDGIKDCPEGDDERQCVSIRNNFTEAETFPYHNTGYLMVRKHGLWGKLCVDNLKNISGENISVSLHTEKLGEQFCSDLSYRNMSSVQTLVEDTDNGQEKFYELVNADKKDNDSSWTFSESTCPQKNILKVSCQSLECGFRPKIVRYRARIVGGKNAGMGSWPWQAALYKEGEFQCGGSLISDKWLISAGHCFYKSQREYWVARLGALRRSTALPSPYEQINPLQKIFIHPGYEHNGFVNDIALLKLRNPARFSDYVRPVCLPKAEESLEDDVQCTILGWGQLSEVGRIFHTLQEVQVPVISTEECRKRTIFLPLYNITEEMFCAGYDRGGRDACLGDSGGPFICPEESGRWVIQGITSNGYGCARANRPGVYTKVSSYINWIQGYLDLEESNPLLEQKENECTGHRCPLGQCLPRSQVCNGYTECNDGSDEANC